MQVILALIVTVTTVVWALVDRMWCGADFDVACAHASQCAGWSSDCIRGDDGRGYCTYPCSDARPCPPGFACTDHLRSGDSAPARVCIRTAPPR